MDANGKITIEYGQFDEVYFAQNNLIRVKVKNKYGYTDRKLNIVIPARFTEASDFKDSLAVCKTKTENTIINTKGNSVFKTKGQIQHISNGLFWIEEENGNFIVNKNGTVIFNSLDSYSISNINSYDNAGTFLVLTFDNMSKKVIKL
jgi:hypothetical protein